jgi:hypothetical protein
MNVDGDDEESQRPRTVSTYGIQVDFDSLDDDEREVCSHYSCFSLLIKFT